MSKDYYFIEIYKRLKEKYPDLNFEYNDKTDQEEIVIKFNGREELDVTKIKNINDIIDFLKSNHYEISNPLDISIGFSYPKNTKVDHKVWRKGYEISYYKYHDISKGENIEDFIGEPNLLFVKFKCNFADSDALDEYLKEEIKDLQSWFNSLNEEQILEELIGSPKYSYEEKTYWLYNTNLKASEIKDGIYYLV